MISKIMIIINIIIKVTLPFLCSALLWAYCEMQAQKRRLEKDFHFIIGMQRDGGYVRGEGSRGIEVCVLEQFVVERQKNS